VIRTIEPASLRSRYICHFVFSQLAIAPLSDQLDRFCGGRLLSAIEPQPTASMDVAPCSISRRDSILVALRLNAGKARMRSLLCT
jgi:hypothetical protein